ncbi:MAG: type I secretion system permease/ATPase, partial [Maricaulaceae bacterium]
VLVTGSVETLLFISAVLLASLVTLAALDAARARIMAAASRRLDRLIGPDVLAAQLAMRGENRSAQPLRDFDVVRNTLTGAPALAAVDAPWTPIYIAVSFIIHPWLGWLSLAGGVVILGVAAMSELSTRRALSGGQASGANAYSLISADAAHGETAQALGMHASLVRRQIAARAAMTSAQAKAAGAAAGYTSTIKFLRLAMQSAALGLGGYLAINQQISAGAIIAGSILTARAFAPLEQIVTASRQYNHARTAFGNLRALLSSHADKRRQTQLPAPDGALGVERLTVRAPGGALLLNDISFSVEPGSILGVVGPSGAGKTTLTRALVGAIAPSAGEVRISGARLSDWPSERLGPYIGYMPQEVGLFTGTIAENISRFADPSQETAALDAAIIAAARAANVHEFILTTPDGYDTRIGPDGAGLSAGQAQRIALARALFASPVLIVLDEPNAHLDAEGEAALIAALTAARDRGAAVVVVAHRAGFMRIADKLLVLKDGAVQAFGDRDDVMDKLAPVSGRAQATEASAPLSSGAQQ